MINYIIVKILNPVKKNIFFNLRSKNKLLLKSNNSLKKLQVYKKSLKKDC